MYRGYLKLYRRLLDSKMWLAEPFTRGQAWVDLIGLANHEDGYIRKRGIKVEVKRGEVGWGERELAARWRWSRNKVRRFLFELCSEYESKMIPQTEPQNKNVTSCYLIVNYELYQGNGTAKGTTNDTTEGPQKDRKRYQNKNEKNEKNEKPLPEWLDSDIWNDFREHRKKLRKPMTSKAEQIMVAKLEDMKANGYNPRHLLITAIERGWLTVYEPKEA
jgi:hypothetical protein